MPGPQATAHPIGCASINLGVNGMCVSGGVFFVDERSRKAAAVHMRTDDDNDDLLGIGYVY